MQSLSVTGDMPITEGLAVKLIHISPFLQLNGVSPPALSAFLSTHAKLLDEGPAKEKRRKAAKGKYLLYDSIRQTHLTVLDSILQEIDFHARVVRSKNSNVGFHGESKLPEGEQQAVDANAWDEIFRTSVARVYSAAETIESKRHSETLIATAHGDDSHKRPTRFSLQTLAPSFKSALFAMLQNQAQPLLVNNAPDASKIFLPSMAVDALGRASS